jgi:hypothetical protein
MKKATGKPHTARRELRNIRRKMIDLSEKLTQLQEDYSTFDEYLEEINTGLWDVKDMIEDKLVMNVPTSPAEALSILERRYPVTREEEWQAWKAIVSAWSRASELRALVRRTPRQIRNYFIGMLQASRSDDNIWQDLPLQSHEVSALEAIKLEWSRAAELRDLVSRADSFTYVRFVALFCFSASL